ncbi:MAG: hypothetical protein CVU91_02415 [Firmicutes bacterium HGW-Firmicutes-16]|nr:MAG: hypothetical protein CVU91_02415 [Firmicutes bacterium HGW-Firmicutes-16]
MQRKIIAVMLVILFLAPFIQTANADNSGLCFTATNDLLLDTGSMTTFVGGIAYVPAKVFSTYGVYLNYDSKSTALLYNSTKQVFFELASGNSTDGSGNILSVSATLKNGQVYVPVAWVCQYFSLYYSYISGDGYGDIIRIKNGGEVLTDSQFLNAASSLMRTRYNEYYGTTAPATPTPTPSKPVTSDNETEVASASLSFIGLPSEKLLDSLDNYSAKVCFFVTASEVATSPDVIRRICGSGHSIGIYCASSPEQECIQAADLIFEAAQIRPTLIFSSVSISENAEAYAGSNGYAYFDPAIEILSTAKRSLDITSKLDDIVGYTSIIINVTENTDSIVPYVLQYASSHHVTLMPLRETMV